MRNLLICFLCFIFLGSFIQAGGISVSQSLDNSNIAFEDSVIFEITLQWDGSQTAYLFDKPLNPYIDRLKVRGFTSSITSSTSSGKDITTKKFKYVLIPTSAGVGKIDPISINYISLPDSLPGELITEAMTINIASPKIVEIKESFSFWWMIIPGIIIVIVAIVVFLKFKRSRKLEIPTRTPKEQFLENLVAIKHKSGSEMKNFQTDLYKILMEYIQERYKINPMKLSEEELKKQLAANNLSETQTDKLCGWLSRAHKDKYSPVSSIPGETIRLESEIREFFEKL